MYGRKTTSDKQPVAKRQLFTFTDYQGEAKKPSLAVELEVKDMTALYAEHPRMAGSRPFLHSWNSVDSSTHIKRTIRDADSALSAVDKFEFPADIRARAQRASRLLTDVFAEVAAKVVVHDQLSGRIDRRKFRDVAKGFQTGEMDIERIRPYRRTDYPPARLPSIAIVSSGSWYEMWRDEHYIARILELTLSIQWACEATGLTVQSALTQGFYSSYFHSKKYADATIAYKIQSANSVNSVRQYAAMFHRDLYRYGMMCALAADPVSITRICQLQYPGQTEDRDIKEWTGRGFPSDHGGSAVQLAREVWKSDLVIAIGDIRDASKADIALDNKLTLDAAVSTIAEKAKKLRKES